MRQRKTKGLHDEDETLLSGTVVDSTVKIWLRRLESLAWITVAFGIAHFTNLVQTARDLAHGWPFFLATSCSICFILLFLLVMYIQPFYTGRQVDLSQWELETPKAIYLATLLGLVAYISTVTMLWPAYHLFSFPIVFLELAGLIALTGLFY